MCVLIAAKRKKFVKRAEIVEAMRTNSSGFAMMAVRPDNSRDSIRTLSDKELLDFFDNKVKDDDAIAFHARIPSRGEKSLANVHGWMIEGVWTGHNMTISTLDEVMREDKWNGTDSEYFFRNIFGPLYKGLGDAAFKDGKFHPYIDRIIRCFMGSSNKFLFVLPDGTFVRYGSWVSEPDRKENGEIAFWASNSTYKVYERSWSAASSGKTARGGYDCDYGYDERDYYLDYWRNRAAPHPSKTSNAVDFDGTTLVDAAGLLPVVRTGLKLHVLANAARYREAMTDDLPEGCTPGPAKAIAAVCRMPVEFAVDDRDLADAANPCDYLPENGTVGSPEHFRAWAAGWAAALEEHIETIGGKMKTRYFHMPKVTLKSDLANLEDRIDAALVSIDCCVDLTQGSLEDAFTAFALSRSRKGRPTMAKAMLTDLITPDMNTEEEARAAVATVLAAIQAMEAGDESVLQAMEAGDESALDAPQNEDNVASDPETQEGVLET